MYVPGYVGTFHCLTQCSLLAIEILLLHSRSAIIGSDIAGNVSVVHKLWLLCRCNSHSHHSQWERSQGSNYFHLVKEGCIWHRCLLAFSTPSGHSPTGSVMGLSTEERGNISAAHFLSEQILMLWRTRDILEKKFDASICCPFDLPYPLNS